MTETITTFGRYYPIYQTLEKELLGKKINDVLIIGPGSVGTVSFQPFEVANVLLRTSSEGFHIDITDVKPWVLQIFQPKRRHGLARIVGFLFGHKDENVIAVHKRFSMEQLIKMYGDQYNVESYIDDFFSDHQRKIKNSDNRLVDTTEILKLMRTYLLDLARDDFPQPQYDLVVCTAVMGAAALYQRNIYEKLRSATKEGGYIVTEPVFDENSDMAIIDELKEGNLHTIRLYRRNAS